MDLVSKYDLIEKIVKTDNEILLQQVKHLLEEEEAESWEDLDPELKASIKRGLKQADNGEVTPHKKVMKEMRKKYLKKR
jgi:predicted transcriptional regulator